MVTCLLLLMSAVLLTASAQKTCNPSNPCPDQYACHPYKNVCIQEPTAITQRPTVWLDETDDRCERKETDCAIFGLEAAGSHPRGRGQNWCKTGEVIRCQAPAAPDIKNTPVTELKVMTYNVWERAFWVTNDGQRERTCRIPTWIIQNHPDVDVIGLQEVFMGGCFADQLDMRALFCHYGWCHSTPTVDAPETAQPGGMFLISRWPILSQDQLVFDEANDDSWDMFAAKGVSYGKVRKSVKGQFRNYHVMTTHLQSGKNASKVREAQTGEWGNWLKEKKLPADEAVIFSGDLNSDWYTEKESLNTIISSLGAAIPDVIGTLNVTSDPATNDCNDEGDSMWIDWVLYSRGHLVPVAATQMALYPTWDTPFPACWCEQCVSLNPDYVWPDDDSCNESPRKVRHLSDHFPVLGSFTFK